MKAWEKLFWTPSPSLASLSPTIGWVPHCAVSARMSNLSPHLITQLALCAYGLPQEDRLRKEACEFLEVGTSSPG